VTELEKALTTEPKDPKPANEDVLRMYLVLRKDSAKVVRKALRDIGVGNGNYAGFLRQAVLNEIKRRQEAKATASKK
jgi:hypothetical protein